jgi:hypothetical protein
MSEMPNSVAELAKELYDYGGYVYLLVTALALSRGHTVDSPGKPLNQAAETLAPIMRHEYRRTPLMSQVDTVLQQIDPDQAQVLIKTFRLSASNELWTDLDPREEMFANDRDRTLANRGYQSLADAIKSGQISLLAPSS